MVGDLHCMYKVFSGDMIPTPAILIVFIVFGLRDDTATDTPHRTETPRSAT